MNQSFQITWKLLEEILGVSHWLLQHIRQHPWSSELKSSRYYFMFVQFWQTHVSKRLYLNESFFVSIITVSNWDQCYVWSILYKLKDDLSIHLQDITKFPVCNGLADSSLIQLATIYLKSDKCLSSHHSQQ